MSDCLALVAVEYCADAKADANVLGEFLRAWAFPGEEYGCYSTFELRPEFEAAAVTAREFEFLWGRPFRQDDTEENDWGYCDVEAAKAIKWFKHPSGIEAGWHWDGDGTLAFWVPGFGLLRNGDCKKDHEWEAERCQPVAATASA